MAVTYVGAAADDSGSGTSNSPRVTMPSTSAGDIAVMWVSSNTGSESYSSGANWSGWSQNGSTQYNGTVLATAMFVKTCDGSESSQSTGPNLGGGRRWTCSVVVIRGATLDQVVSDQKTTTSTTTSVPCPDATPSANDAMVVAFAATLGQGNSGTSYTYTSGANYTERTDVCTSSGGNLNSGATLATRQLSGGSGSPETPSAFTTSANVGRQNRWTLTFIPAATPVGQTVQTVWNARAAIGKSNQLKWHVRAAVARTAQLKWHVRTAVTKSVQTIWKVRATVGKNVQAVWDVAAAVAKSVQTVWGVRTTAAKSVQVVWNVTVSAGKSVQTKWHTRAAVGKSAQTVWDTRALAGAAAQVVWNVRTIAGKAVQLVWDVVSPLASVGQTVQAVWHTRATAARTAQARWHVRTLAAREAHTIWHTRALAGAQVQSRWRVRAKVGESIQLGWRTAGLAGVAVALQWHTREVAGSAVSLLWRVRIPMPSVGRQIALRWRVTTTTDRPDQDRTWPITAGTTHRTDAGITPRPGG